VRLLMEEEQGEESCLLSLCYLIHRIIQPVSVLPLHPVFVQMLNRVSDWTNPYDFGPGVSDETFLSAYLMYRRTTVELSSLASCGVSASDPCSPLRNCSICSPAHPGGGCRVLLRIDCRAAYNAAHKLSNASAQPLQITATTQLSLWMLC